MPGICKCVNKHFTGVWQYCMVQTFLQLYSVQLSMVDLDMGPPLENFSMSELNALTKRNISLHHVTKALIT